jgi:hypothetical protein
VTESAVLSVPLPTGDPTSIRSTARSLDSTADRLAALGRRGVSVFDTEWAGAAAEAGADRIARLSVRLLAESLRCREAAEALWVFATRVDFALGLAADARRLLDQAYATQQAADVADPALAAGRSLTWTGASSTSYFGDPEASRLVDCARRTAWDANSLARRAVRDVVDELSSLCGVSLAHRGLSPRMLVDLAGFVPVVGDAIDAGNGLVYLLQGDTLNAGLSLGAVVPGPLGWGATSGRIGKTLTDAEVIDVVRRAADPLQARHIDPDFAPIYRDRDRLVAKAVESTDQTARRLTADFEQLEAKYKHATKLLGLPANGNPRYWPVFEQRMRDFAEAETTVRIDGTYRGRPAILYVDTVDMRRVVLTEPDAAFWSTWILRKQQAVNVWERHAL